MSASVSGSSTPLHGLTTLASSTLSARIFEDNIQTGFQLSTLQGPLCAEPVQGTAIFLEQIQLSILEDDLSNVLRARMGHYSGHVISTVRDAIKEGFLQWSPRLMLAVYNVDIQASSKPPNPPTNTYVVTSHSRSFRESVCCRDETPWEDYR